MSKKFKRVALIPALVLSLGVVALSSCGDKPTVPPTTEPTVPTVPTVVNPIPADLVITISNKEELGKVAQGDADVAVKVVLTSASDQAAATKLKGLVVITSSDTAILTIIGKYAHFVAPGAATITVTLPGSTATDTVGVAVAAPVLGTKKTALQITQCAKEGIKDRVHVEGQIVEVFTGGGVTGYLVADASGICYAFGALKDGFKKGDVVLVTGAVEQYHGIGEFKGNKDVPLNIYHSTATIELPADETTPVVWDAMEPYETYSKQKDGKFKAIKVTSTQFKAVQKGTFLSYSIGDSELIGRFAYKWDPAEGGFVDGHTYTVTGYAYGRSSGEGADFYPTAVKENPIETLTSFEVSGPNKLGVGSSSNIKIKATLNADTSYVATYKAKADEKLVKIDGKKITGLKAGTATIVVTPTADPSLVKELVITVANPEIIENATAATIKADQSATKLYRVKATVTAIDPDSKDTNKPNVYGNGTLTFTDSTELDLGGLTATNVFSFVEGILSMSNDKSFASTCVKVGDVITMVGQSGKYGFQGYLENVVDETLYTTTIGALTENVTSVVANPADGAKWKSTVTITAVVAAAFEAKVVVKMGEQAIAVKKEQANGVYSFVMPRGKVTITVTAEKIVPIGSDLVINPNDLLGEGEFIYNTAPTITKIRGLDFSFTDVMKSTWDPNTGAIQLQGPKASNDPSKVKLPGTIVNSTEMPKAIKSIVIKLKSNTTAGAKLGVDFGKDSSINAEMKETAIGATAATLEYTFTPTALDNTFMKIKSISNAIYIDQITINFVVAA